MRRVLHVHVKVLARVHVEEGGAAAVLRRLDPGGHGRGERGLADDFPDLGILEELTEDGVGRVRVGDGGGQVLAVAGGQVGGRGGGGAGRQLGGAEPLVRGCSQWGRRAVEGQLSRRSGLCSGRTRLKKEEEEVNILSHIFNNVTGRNCQIQLWAKFK